MPRHLNHFEGASTPDPAYRGGPTREQRASAELQRRLNLMQKVRIFRRERILEAKIRAGAANSIHYRLADTLQVLRPTVGLADFKAAMREQYKRQQRAK